MPVLCPRCSAELLRGALRCRFCGADARAAPPAAEVAVMLDFDSPLAKEEAARLLEERLSDPSHVEEEIAVLRAILDD